MQEILSKLHKEGKDAGNLIRPCVMQARDGPQTNFNGSNLP